MVNKERLVELAERCEAATGPDTHLDGLITLETGAIGAFTASLDAAMTLVPEGWDWVINSDDACTLEHPDHAAPLVEAFAATPALALCAAALRSLSTPSMKDDGNEQHDRPFDEGAD